MTEAMISADSHLDVGWLPPDTFTSRMSSTWGDATPHVVNTEEGPRWVSGDIDLSGTAGVGSVGRPYTEGRWKRADRMAQTGLYSDGLNRPGNPEYRVLDQDRDGTIAEVIYGLFSIPSRLNDRRLADDVCRAFNDFLVEFCAYAPDRYIGLACLPVGDPRSAADELVRCADLGFRGVVLDIKNGSDSMYDEAWDPVWDVATRTEIPVAFHLGSRFTPGASSLGTTKRLEGKRLRDAALGMSMLQYLGAADYFSIIFGGALDRFPALRIVLAESGIGWIPSMLERLDYEIDNEFLGLNLQLKPSEYWQRQMFATFSKDEVGLALLDVLGEDRVMFASDYPHPDGIWPDSQSYITTQMGKLSKETRRKILLENAAKLYHLSGTLEETATTISGSSPLTARA
jgi:uncharacterized protein